MRNNVFLTISQALLDIDTRFLPNAISSRTTSNLFLGLIGTTFACGLYMSLYSTYQDLYYLYLEHRISRSIDQLDKLEAKNAAATRRYQLLEEVVQRGDRIIVDLERWDQTRNELENLVAFRQMPVACAVTDESDLRFEGYDVFVQKKDIRRKMKDLVKLDKQLSDDMEWWSAQGQKEIKRKNPENYVELSVL